MKFGSKSNQHKGQGNYWNKQLLLKLGLIFERIINVVVVVVVLKYSLMLKDHHQHPLSRVYVKVELFKKKSLLKVNVDTIKSTCLL